LNKYLKCSHRKAEKGFFLQLKVFDMCTTGDMAHIDTIFKLLPHASNDVDACVATTWISYRCVPCHRGAHIENL